MIENTEAGAHTWTDGRVLELKTLWRDGYTASQIAAKIGGFEHCGDGGRSAVCGKVHRLGLGGRKVFARAPLYRPKALPRYARQGQKRAADSDRAAKQRIAKIVKVRSPSHGGPRIEPAVIREPDPDLEQFNAAIPQQQRRQLLDHDFDHTKCHFPIGDPCERASFFYCGGKVDEGRTYCAFHMRIAYRVPPPPRPQPYFPNGHTRA